MTFDMTLEDDLIGHSDKNVLTMEWIHTWEWSPPESNLKTIISLPCEVWTSILDDLDIYAEQFYEVFTGAGA